MNAETTLVDDGKCLLIRIPMQFKKRGGRKELFVAEGSGPPAPPPQDALIVAVARAYRWNKLLESEEVDSIADLGTILKIERTNVGRILRLTTLAPDIAEAILDGREPSGLSLTQITKQKMPLLWNEQRELYGFPPK